MSGGGRVGTSHQEIYYAKGRKNTHVWHIRCERGAVQRRLRLERLEHGQRLRIMYPSCLVLAARDEVGPVRGQL